MRLIDEHLNKDLPIISATLTRDYDDFLRLERTSIAHPVSQIPFYGSTYNYDAVGRLGSVTNDRSGDAFTYGYQDQSFGLVRTVTGPVHTVTNDWEAHRNILDQKTNGPVASPISSYDYTVNSLGQRTNLVTAGSAFSVQPALTWTYNARGELVETADASSSNFDRAYQYDGIGNREKTAEVLLVALPGSPNYQADALNQYSSVTLGSTTLSPVHDLDGNAASYPLPADASANSTLVWDGENRLVTVTTPNNEVTTFEYDYLSRRMTKGTTTGTTTTTTECYFYDGWNLILEKRAPSVGPFNEIRLYTWGQDLSGSMQGAGGVAGLLAIESQTDFSIPVSSDYYYPTYDGNGNVSEYLDSTGLVVAHFEYDPFGNTTVNTDTAGLFDILFSTKKKDLATGLYYYGYRYYDPVTGRWPSRDPIGERGGFNLYGMVGNNALSKVDILGLEEEDKVGFWESLANALPKQKFPSKIDRIVQKGDLEIRYDAIRNESLSFFGNVGGYGQPSFNSKGRHGAWRGGYSNWFHLGEDGSLTCWGEGQTCNSVINDRSANSGSLYVDAKRGDGDGCCLYLFSIDYRAKGVRKQKDKKNRVISTSLQAGPHRLAFFASDGENQNGFEKEGSFAFTKCICANSTESIFTGEVTAQGSGENWQLRSFIGADVTGVKNLGSCKKGEDELFKFWSF